MLILVGGEPISYNLTDPNMHHTKPTSHRKITNLLCMLTSQTYRTPTNEATYRRFSLFASRRILENV